MRSNAAVDDSSELDELKRLQARLKQLQTEAEELEQELAAREKEPQGVVDDTALFPESHPRAEPGRKQP